MLEPRFAESGLTEPLARALQTASSSWVEPNAEDLGPRAGVTNAALGFSFSWATGSDDGTVVGSVAIVFEVADGPRGGQGRGGNVRPIRYGSITGDTTL